MTLLSVKEARERILAEFQPVGFESVPLSFAAGRILFTDISAMNDLPLFDNSSMDGFALRSIDTTDASPGSPLTLEVVGDIPAGSTSTFSLVAGQAARIMTGAQLPLGADAVIPVEDTDFNERSPGTPAPKTITFTKVTQKGENVRPRGMDVHAGNLVLGKGKYLKPQDAGLLGMLGYANVDVFRRPRIALLSSGDELIEAGDPLEAGKIHDSNSYMLASLVENAGCELVRLGIARDTRESVQTLLDKAITENVDMILTSAGVSVGAFDYVKEVIESHGKLNFWKVNMRPGKPLAFGEYRKTPFVGLPGNPVSAFVGFEVFVRDVLGKLAGRSDGGRHAVRVRCDEEILSDGRESYLRAVVLERDGKLRSSLTGHQGSGNLLSLVQANALLIIPAGVKCVPAGQEVDAWLL